MSESTVSHPQSLAHSIGWLGQYARRRWRAMLVVLGAMLVRVGLDLLKPWPMKILVDNVLKQMAAHPLVERLVNALPGPHDRATLVLWCVGATVALPKTRTAPWRAARSRATVRASF